MFNLLSVLRKGIFVYKMNEICVDIRKALILIRNLRKFVINLTRWLENIPSFSFFLSK